MINKVIKLMCLTLFVSAYAANISVKQTKTSEWNSGFCETVEVKNLDSESVQWQVEFVSDGVIKNLWNANYTQDGNIKVVASGVSWNNTLSSNETASFGYCADKVE